MNSQGHWHLRIADYIKDKDQNREKELRGNRPYRLQEELEQNNSKGYHQKGRRLHLQDKQDAENREHSEFKEKGLEIECRITTIKKKNSVGGLEDKDLESPRKHNTKSGGGRKNEKIRGLFSSTLLSVLSD